MFKSLKKKLKSAISKVSKKVEESKPEESSEGLEKKEKSVEETKPEKPKEKKLKKDKPKQEKSKKAELIKEIDEIKDKEAEEPSEEKQPEKEKQTQPEKQIQKPAEKKEQQKKSVLKKLKSKLSYNISEKLFEQIFDELEIILLENNVALKVIDVIKKDLKKELVGKQIPRKKVELKIKKVLKNSIQNLFEAEDINILELTKQKKPLVVCFVGVNGSGKTTTLAKIASMLKQNNKKVIVAASDTFRAAAIQQVQEHTDKLGIKLIKHDYGADAAAVAYDAIKYAKSHDTDVVLIDTAGRLHSNKNLMQEIKKLKRVTNPDLTIFVGESITGNDCIEQARTFNQEIGIDAIILSKADIDEKGGAAISVSHITGKPIIFIGTGQEYKDLKEFNSELVVKSLGL
ncbi:MAG: Signal recognition particle receptor FtsY [Candidatus Woesearchaeota archaeon]|nr:Signal recognition particle receptor FtsY [Candidatus Woesearchaeota archaeon]